MIQKNSLRGVFCMVFILVINHTTKAQTTIYTLDFESTGGYTTNINEDINETTDYFGRIQSGVDSPNPNFTNIQGNYYFGAQDIDGLNSAPALPVSFLINDINIAGYTTLQLRVFLAEDDAGSNQDWDATDFVHFSADINNTGIFTNILNIEATSGINTEPAIDINFDGLGNGNKITDVFTQFTADISGIGTLSTGSLLDLQIEFNLNSGDEDIAIDHIEIIGITTTSNPTITFNDSASTENETDITFATSGIPITLSNYESDVTITTTVNENSTAEVEDYTIDLSPLVFDDNETLRIPLSIHNDNDFEDETLIIDFTITSGSADLVTTTHTITILDNDEEGNNPSVNTQTTTIDFEVENYGYTLSESEGTTYTDVFNRIDRTENPLGGNSSFLFAIEDTNLSDPSIQLNQIDVNGSTSFTFSIDMLTHHYNDWDNSDELKIMYSIDGGAYQNLMWIQSITAPSSASNEPAAIDTDFDGSGECTNILPALTLGTSALGCIVSNNNFETFTTAPIALSSNATLDIKLQFNGLTATDEGLYLDNIVITETVVSSVPMITFDSSSSTQIETDATFSTSGIPVTLTNYDTDVTVTAFINESSTAEAEDYTIDLTALVFDDNKTLNIPLSIHSDSDYEDETIVIDISVTSGSAEITTSQHIVTITDDESLAVPSLIISEVADPNNNPNNSRFIEIYNNGDTTIDLTTEEIHFIRQSNGSRISALALTGTIAPNEVMTIGRSGNLSVYGFSANIESGLLTGNGDDGYFLYYGGDESTGTLLDAYGVLNVDGTDKPWEYEDSRAVRLNPNSVTPNAIWTASEWAISSANLGDVTPGALENEFRFDGDWKPRNITNATSSDNIFISSSTTFSNSLEVNNFEITNAAIVTINSGATLKINGTATGNITYNKALTANLWHLISSPIEGQGVASFFNNEPKVRLGSGSGTLQNIAIAHYNNSQVTGTNPWSYYTFGQVDGLNNDDTDHIFANGTGYSISISTSKEVSFTGTIPTSNQSFTLTYGGANNFNLIGNSFTAFFTLGDFYSTNTNSSLIDTDFYFWNGSQYITRTSGGNASFEVSPGQAFFVESLSPGSISFDTSNLIIGTGNTFDKSIADRTEITLHLSDGKHKRFANIIYIDKATSSYDKGYDGKLFDGVPQDFVIYTELIDSDSKKYQLQALPNSNYEDMIIPVGVIANAGKEISFTTESINLPKGIKVFLEDRLTNTFTRLDEPNSEYKISLTKKLNGIGRFYLHTKSNVLSNSESYLKSVSIFKFDESTLRITGLSQEKTTIVLYNMLGKKVFESSFTANGIKNVSLPNLTTGVYVVQLATEKGRLNKKITFN